MARFKQFVFSAALVLPVATGFAAQDATTADGSRVIQLRSSTIGNTSNQEVAIRPIAVPPALMVDPSQVSFDAIGTTAKASAAAVPAVLQDPTAAVAATVEKVTYDGAQNAAKMVAKASEVAAPRVARADSPSWNRNVAIATAAPKTKTSNSNQTSNRGQRPVAQKTPAIATDIVAPEFINVNQTAKMVINLRNNGNADAQSVRLLATLPEHAKFQRSTPQPTSVDGQQYTFKIDGVVVNDVRQVVIELVPTEKRPLEIATGVVVENRQSIAVGVREPELTLHVEGPTQVTLGETVEHVVVIENFGDGVAEAVRLEAELPDELRFTEQNGMDVAKSLAPGEKRKVTVKSIAQKPGIVDLGFIASAVGSNSQPTISKLKIIEPKLNVSLAGPRMNFVNRNGIYSIRLDNTGEVAVSDVKVRLSIPAGMKVTTINRPAKADEASQALTWTFDQIAAQTTELIQLKTTATEAGDQTCQIDVSSQETREKQFELTTMVATRAEMSVNVRNQSGPVQVGEKAEFSVVVENNGSSDADNVTVRVELPETMMPVKQDGTTVDEYNRSYVFTKPALAAGQTHEFTFVAVGAAKGEFVVRGVLENGESQPNVIAEDTIYVYEVDEFRVSEALSPLLDR